MPTQQELKQQRDEAYFAKMAAIGQEREKKLAELNRLMIEADEALKASPDDADLQAKFSEAQRNYNHAVHVR